MTSGRAGRGLITKEGRLSRFPLGENLKNKTVTNFTTSYNQVKSPLEILGCLSLIAVIGIGLLHLPLRVYRK